MIPAGAIRKRAIIRQFLEAGAVSEETARTPEEAGVFRGLASNLTSWWSGAFWSPVLEDGITWTSAKAVEKGRRFRRKRLPFFIMPVFPGAAVISRAGTRLLWYPRDGSNALKAAYLMALVRTSSARRAWNWTQDMAPRSSPERMRTETV